MKSAAAREEEKASEKSWANIMLLLNHLPTVLISIKKAPKKKPKLENNFDLKEAENQDTNKLHY